MTEEEKLLALRAEGARGLCPGQAREVYSASGACGTRGRESDLCGNEELSGVGDSENRRFHAPSALHGTAPAQRRRPDRCSRCWQAPQKNLIRIDKQQKGLLSALRRQQALLESGELRQHRLGGDCRLRWFKNYI